MRYASSKLDHPLAVVTATIALSALLLLIMARLERSVDGVGADALLTFGVFACGGALFAIYAPAAARWSRALAAHDIRLLFVFGLSFAGWGFLLLPMLGGLFGLLHAITCTAAILAMVRDWRVAVAPIPALAPAWAVTFRLSEGPNALPVGQIVWMLIPVLVWNIEMSVVFAGWSAWRRVHPLPDPAKHCAACGYDLAGLREPICPECGSGVAPAGWRSNDSNRDIGA
ncbi:MAG: hypothetical protein ACF8R7_12985 [Phycisphaerales bacterium JB039]